MWFEELRGIVIYNERFFFFFFSRGCRGWLRVCGWGGGEWRLRGWRRGKG